MPESTTLEFMRFSAPDAQAHRLAIAELRQKLEQALLAGETLAIVDHVADLGGLLTTDRQEVQALQLLREHAAAAEQLPLEEPAGWFWNAYATALQYCGHRVEADGYFAKALRLCEASGWTRLQAMVLHHWGRSLAEQRRFEQAQARIAEALALRVQMNDPRQELSRRALEALDQLRNPSASMRIALESPDQPEVIALITELDAYQDSLYPPESRHALDLASLKQPNVLFAVARDAAGQALGCGAIVLGAEFGELKRMFVSPRARGHGLARRLLNLLETEAAARGCRTVTLETGPYQAEALGLYAACGYDKRGPFGGYANDPLSVFMEKALLKAPAADPA